MKKDIYYCIVLSDSQLADIAKEYRPHEGIEMPH